MAQCLRSWIPYAASNAESPFYPAGILLHGSEDKGVLLLWSRNAIKSLVFRGLCGSRLNDLPPSTTHLLSISASTTPSSKITQVLVGALETLVLTSCGRVLCFRSSKTLQPVAQHQNVKCACVTTTGFAMIRLSPDGSKICIQLQPATLDTADQKEPDRIYDVSFEANSCQSTWNDSWFRIKEFQPRPESHPLFQMLQNRHDDSLRATDVCLAFSINNHLLVLVVGNTDEEYSVNLVHSFESNISDFWLSNSGEALYIRLESGAMDVLHCCRLVRIAARRSHLFFGDRVDCLEVFQDVVVYSNGCHVLQSRIVYCSKSDSYSLQRIHKTDLFGVVAITQAPDDCMILAVTENNKIYKIALKTDAQIIDDPLEASMCSVDDAFMKEAKKELADVVRLAEVYEQVKSDTISQLNDKRILNLVKQCSSEHHLNWFPYHVKIHAVNGTPVFDANTIVLEPIGTSNPFSVTVNINLVANWTTDCEESSFNFAQNNWVMSIRELHPIPRQSTIRNLRITGNMFEKPLNVKFIINPFIDVQLSIPDFQISISTFVIIGAEFVLLTFPVKTNAMDIAKLFSVHDHQPLEAIPRECPKRRRRTMATVAPVIKYEIHLPIPIVHDDILQLFPIRDINTISGDVFVTLLGRTVRMSTVPDSKQLFLLSSADAMAMYYVKLFISLGLNSKFRYQLRAEVPITKEIRMVISSCRTIESRAAECGQSKNVRVSEREEINSIIERLRKATRQVYQELSCNK